MAIAFNGGINVNTGYAQRKIHGQHGPSPRSEPDVISFPSGLAIVDCAKEAPAGRRSVFVYHNGADSYYKVRGFRCKLS
ncbi:DUF4256 domain-containing protein [Lactobacillus sp.]|uniref:DUF4256 domain-containing protein n=1 Tax=Lactobacillus sp. TaxID=1591 RepID=UPI003EF80A55